MKMVKGLTKANANKYGIEIREDLNFSDDGNYFRGFSYKGMPMTQCRSEGICYLSIRVDYQHNNFTYKEWMNTKEYHLADEFNGVVEFDIEKLIENLEAIILKVNEMNSNASINDEDISKAVELVKAEIKGMKEIIDFAKTNFNWWNASEYEVSRIKDYMTSLERKIKIGYKLIITKCDCNDISKAKCHIERMNDTGKILDGEWYKSQIVEIVNKYIEN